MDETARRQDNNEEIWYRNPRGRKIYRFIAKVFNALPNPFTASQTYRMFMEAEQSYLSLAHDILLSIFLKIFIFVLISASLN